MVVVSPFDLRAALTALHAQHVVLIHFPIALCVTSVAFDWLARWSKQTALAAAAYYNLLAAAAMTLPACVTGLLAWQWQLEGQRLKGNLLLHMLFGISGSLLIWLVWWLHARARRHSAPFVPAYVLAIELVTMAVVGVAAHVGGILSGVNVVN